MVCDPSRGGGHAETDTTRGTPRGPRDMHQKDDQDVDPHIPGYVFWLVMFRLLSFHQLVLRVT